MTSKVLSLAHRIVTNNGLMVIAAVVLCWALAQKRRTGRWPRISRDATTDAIYWLFYSAGVFAFVGGTRAIAGMQWALHRWAPFLELNLVRGKPMLVQWVAITVACDFSSYWWHRATHSSRLLWIVHRAHHSATQLNPITNYRVHVIDFLGRAVFMVPCYAILGADAKWFAGLILAQVALNTLAHADLGWSYGPFGYLVVSPRHHRIHHAEDVELSQHNFGILLSVWDYLFRTATKVTERPERFGVAGEVVPRGFIGQQIEPLVLAFKRLVPRRPVPVTSPQS